MVTINLGAVVQFFTTYVEQDESKIGINVINTSFIRFERSKVYNSAGSNTGINVLSGSSMAIAWGAIVDNWLTGIKCTSNASVTFAGGVATYGDERVQNCTTGISALQGGQVIGTANAHYTSNTTDESATAASYGYID